MRITDLTLGQFSAGDDKNIPDKSARQLQNLVYENGVFTRRKGVTPANSGLTTAILAKGTPLKIWSWKPAVQITGRDELYYFVHFSNNRTYLFYLEDGWESHEIPANINSNSSLTVYASSDSLLISDGISEPSRIIVKDNGSMDYSALGLSAPTYRPILSNASYTDETDQSYFSQASYVRVVYTFTDKRGIESNPSPVSEAYNGQRYIYDEGEQVGFIKAITVSNIYVDSDDIKYVTIYVELLPYSEGEGDGNFTYSAKYPVAKEYNEFRLTISGNGVDFVSYENDVLKVADNITKASDVIFVGTGDQIYSADSKFRFLQILSLQNINPQTFVNKPIRLRLYNQPHPTSPAIQQIPNFNITHFQSDTDLPFIRMYDTDKVTMLDVLILDRDPDNEYMDIVVKMTISAGETKIFFLAFTPRGDDRTGDYQGYYGIENAEGEFGTDETMARKVFSKLDVLNADTEIACWGDDTVIDGVHAGRINYADGNNEPTDESTDLYPNTKIVNTIPVLYDSGNDLRALNIYSDNRSYLRFDWGSDILPQRYFLSCRTDILLGTASSTHELMEVHKHIDSSSQDEGYMFIRAVEDTSNNELSFRLYVINDDGDTEENRLMITFNYAQYSKTIGDDEVVSIFALWTVRTESDGEQTHRLYITPLYRNQDAFTYQQTETDVHGDEQIQSIRYGRKFNGYSGATHCAFVKNIFLEDDTDGTNLAAVKCMANYMPLYLTDVLGIKFPVSDSEGNKHFSVEEQIDFDNLATYYNNIIRWSDKSGENFSDLNYHRLFEKNTVNIPVRGFYNNQYVPTVLVFTENTISRIILDDTTNQKLGANQIVGEFEGYGCKGKNFVDKFGDIVFWYSKNTNHCYLYAGELPKNISLDKITFDNPSFLFVNDRERQVIVVDGSVQYVYSIDNNHWTEFTGMGVISETQIDDGKSLICYQDDTVREPIKIYPSGSLTDEVTKLETKNYPIDKNLVDRVKIEFTGGNTELDVTGEYQNGTTTAISYGEITSYENYGINERLTFCKLLLTGLDSFRLMDLEIREL